MGFLDALKQACQPGPTSKDFARRREEQNDRDASDAKSSEDSNQQEEQDVFRKSLRSSTSNSRVQKMTPMRSSIIDSKDIITYQSKNSKDTDKKK